MNYEQSNEFLNIIIEYLCRAYQTDYNGLADLIGMNRGWFTRYRNAGYLDKGVNTTMALLKLATSVDMKQLMNVLFSE